MGEGRRRRELIRTGWREDPDYLHPVRHRERRARRQRREEAREAVAERNQGRPPAGKHFLKLTQAQARCQCGWDASPPASLSPGGKYDWMLDRYNAHTRGAE